MRRSGKPRWSLVVSGDWETVISAREYREQLLDQKPFDEQMAEWHVYRIDCETTAAFVAAYRVFCERLKLQCEFEASFISDDRLVRSEMQTGFDGDSEPRCSVDAEFPESKVRDAVKQAIALLEEAMK
jgi:hypothetical protein